MPPAAASKALAYELQERVLCFHGPMLYEAKVLDIKKPESKGEGPMYKVHYKGWKNTWDEYVAADRLRKMNDENLLLQKQLTENNKPASASKKPSTTSASSRKSLGGTKASSEDPPASAPRGQKRGRELEIEKEEDYLKRQDIKIYVPDNLKAILVDDWENVTKNQMLVPLPKEPNVRQILEKYRASVPKKRPGSAEADIFDEIIAGLQLYFDKSLGTILLYRFERQQLLDIMKEHPGKQPSEVYGGEHLLRLCVSLPELLAHTNMDVQAMSKLRDHIEDFVRFLSKQPDQYIANPYESGTTAYKNAVRSEEEACESSSSLSSPPETPEEPIGCATRSGRRRRATSTAARDESGNVAPSRDGKGRGGRGASASTTAKGSRTSTPVPATKKKNLKRKAAAVEEEEGHEDPNGNGREEEEGAVDMEEEDDDDAASSTSDASSGSPGYTGTSNRKRAGRGRGRGRPHGRGRGRSSSATATPGKAEPTPTAKKKNSKRKTVSPEVEEKQGAHSNMDTRREEGSAVPTASNSSSSFLPTPTSPTLKRQLDELDSSHQKPPAPAPVPASILMPPPATVPPAKRRKIAKE